MRTVPESPWQTESDLLAEGIPDTLDMLDCVELPSELCVHAEAAALDPCYADEFDEWMAYLSEQDLFLAVEQSCGEAGILLEWDMRGVRLQTLPAPLLHKLHVFFADCPRHVRALLAHDVYWLVKFERIRRCGVATWGPHQVGGVMSSGCTDG